MEYEITKAKYLIDGEFDNLNALLKRHADKSPRDCTLIWTAMHTGARAREVLNIRPCDLCLQDGTVYIRGLKNSKNREVALPAWLFKRLVALVPEGEDPEAPLFKISYVRFHQIWCLYRPAKKPLHALRHTLAIRLYRKTKDMYLVKVVLGHKAWNSTMVYVTHQYNLSDLKKALLD
jgi:integrase